MCQSGFEALSPGLQVFLRTTESYSTGQLELQCVARRPYGECQVRDDDIIVLMSDEEAMPPGRAAETALVAHEVTNTRG